MDPRCGDKTFPSLGDPPFPAECRDVAVAELRAAGIPRGAEKVTACEVEVLAKGSDAERLASAGVCIPSAVAAAPKEWVTVYRISAEAFGWNFSRAWYYWVAKTSDEPVSKADAAALHERFGQEVRVYGSCACPEPVRDVDSYHIDTPAGLAAFVEVIRRSHEARELAREAELDRKYGRADQLR